MDVPYYPAVVDIGGRPYSRCFACGKVVRVTGFFGSWHLCLSPEELAAQQRAQQQPTDNPQSVEWLLRLLAGELPTQPRPPTKKEDA